VRLTTGDVAVYVGQKSYKVVRQAELKHFQVPSERKLRSEDGLHVRPGSGGRIFSTSPAEPLIVDFTIAVIG
jgi:hypothetical protein